MKPQDTMLATYDRKWLENQRAKLREAMINQLILSSSISSKLHSRQERTTERKPRETVDVALSSSGFTEREERYKRNHPNRGRWKEPTKWRKIEYSKQEVGKTEIESADIRKPYRHRQNVTEHVHYSNK